MKFAILLIIIFLPLSYSLEFGTRPANIKINASINEKKCERFVLYGNDLLFIGDFKLSSKKSRDIEDYTLSPNPKEAEFTYPLNAFDGENFFCVYLRSPKNYYGLLKYRVKDSNFGIVSFVEINYVGNKEFKIERKNLIKNESKSMKINLFLLDLFLFLLLLFFLIV